MKNESFAGGTCLPGLQLTAEKHLALKRNRVDIFPQLNDLYPLPPTPNSLVCRPPRENPV